MTENLTRPNPGECDCCGFGTSQLILSPRSGDRQLYFCKICNSTYAGVSMVFKNVCSHDTAYILKSISYVGNLILKKMDEINNRDG